MVNMPGGGLAGICEGIRRYNGRHRIQSYSSGVFTRRAGMVAPRSSTMKVTVVPAALAAALVAVIAALVCSLVWSLAPGIAGAQSVLDAPSNLTATPGAGAVHLSWTAPANAEYHFVAWLPVGAPAEEAQILPADVSGVHIGGWCASQPD